MESWADRMDRDPHEKPSYPEKITFNDDEMEDLTGGDQSENITEVSAGTKFLLEDKYTRNVRNEERLKMRNR